jgi:hypothetical protein
VPAARRRYGRGSCRSSGEAGAALETPGLDDRPALTGAHPGAEAVLAGSATGVGLIRALHGDSLGSCPCGRGSRWQGSVMRRGRAPVPARRPISTRHTSTHHQSERMKATAQVPTATTYLCGRAGRRPIGAADCFGTRPTVVTSATQRDDLFPQPVYNLWIARRSDVSAVLVRTSIGGNLRWNGQRESSAARPESVPDEWRVGNRWVEQVSGHGD